MDFLEVVEVLVELYEAWKLSPHSHVIMIGRIIIAIVIILVIVVIWGIIKNLVGRRNKR